MQSRCRVSTRRNIRQSAPCQEINNIFNIFKHEMQNTIQIDNSLLKKLPTTHKITCQMIQNMPQSQIPSKQNRQKCLLNMKKMIDFQESLFNKQLEKYESHNQIITPQDLLEMEQQNDECFKEMRKKLMEKTVENKDKKTKDIEEIQIEEDAIYMSDKIRRQLDDYLTIN